METTIANAMTDDPTPTAADELQKFAKRSYIPLLAPVYTSS